MRPSNLAFSVLISLFTLGHPSVSSAQLTLYDDFGGGIIDPERWFGTGQDGGVANPTTEVVRAIKSGRLQLRLNQYGSENSDSGTSTGQVRLNIPNGGSITTLQAIVTVTSADVGACATNPSTTVRARAQVDGGFFNDGSSTGPADRTGDIIAGIQKMSDTALGNVIQAFIVRCTNASCSATGAVAGSGSQVFTTAWAPNQSHALTVQWDAANHQFIYSVRHALRTFLFGKTETITLPYVESDAHAPVVPFRQLVVNNSAANCTGGQQHAFMDVFFDQVMIKP